MGLRLLYTSASQNIASDIEVLTISSLSSQSVNLSPVIAGTAIGIGGSYGNAGSENLANADTMKLTFNAGYIRPGQRRHLLLPDSAVA